ncbi:MAG: HTTM domain-containing protein [Candidatus Omnitrophica bacterium]|nr:HTTM domain-containing protein [Candidatus Omnitrophota bacterium]
MLAAYMAFHMLFLLRHWLYPGRVTWTEAGHFFFRQMIFRTKDGLICFRLKDRR